MSLNTDVSVHQMQNQVIDNLKLELFFCKYTFTTYFQIWYLHLTILYVRINYIKCVKIFYKSLVI